MGVNTSNYQSLRGVLRMTKKYTRVPVELEALRFVYTDEGLGDLEEFCGQALGAVAKYSDAPAEAELRTLEDGHTFTVKHIATEGDYIIKGVNGEFWAVKPDIFQKTYRESGEVHADGCTFRSKVAFCAGTGSGECSGTAEFDPGTAKRLPELSLSDGWNDSVNITFSYCPICGTKLLQVGFCE